MSFRIPEALPTVKMGPDPIRAYFWPAIDAGTFDPTRRYFFDPKGKKLKNLTFLGEIFQIQIQTQTIDGWPDLGQNFLIQTHH